jgi:flavin reductase (DIM6/NTAB) family NADH-FMN oxidoreductase RutF/DNA-binding IclR family transcriptional regulator
VQTTGLPEGAFAVGHFRQVLGQYPTGVVVVTALSGEGAPIGMTVGSFTSVSLDPPLVAFLPDRNSSSWRALRESGKHFCINILSNDQEDVCRHVAVRKQNKFEDIDWHLSPGGLPIIDGCVAYVDCSVEDVFEAGDHQIVLGRVRHLDIENPADPLLFFRGGYGSFIPLSLAAADADLVEQLALVDLVRPLMEELAGRYETEVTAVSLVRNELLLTAAAGKSETAVTPTRVGQRLPFMPPVGSVFAAHGGERVLSYWLANIGKEVEPDQAQRYRAMADRIRERGYSLAIGHENMAELERSASSLNVGDPGVSPGSLNAAIKELGDGYNPASLTPGSSYAFRMASAPVFTAAGDVAFTLNIWGPLDPVSTAEIELRVQALKAVAEDATRAIGGTVRAPA